MPQKIFVGGLSFSTTNEALHQLFAQYGTVVSASVVTDRDTGRSRGFGFVEMASEDEAKRAVGQLSGKEFEGRRLNVDFAKPRSDDSRGGGGGGFSRGRGGRGGWR